MARWWAAQAILMPASYKKLAASYKKEARCQIRMFQQSTPLLPPSRQTQEQERDHDEGEDAGAASVASHRERAGLQARQVGVVVDVERGERGKAVERVGRDRPDRVAEEPEHQQRREPDEGIVGDSVDPVLLQLTARRHAQINAQERKKERKK